MVDTAASFWKTKFDAVNARISELEFENHNLRKNGGTFIKQDPDDNAAQFEDVILAQDRKLIEVGAKNKQLELTLLEEKKYSSNLKATVSSHESTLKAIQQSSSGAKGKLTSALAEAQVEAAALKKELRDVKTDKYRADVEIDLLKKQNPNSVLDIDWKIKKPFPPTNVVPKLSAPVPSKDKRKWDHVNTNATADPKSSWKTKSQSKYNDSDCDNSEPDLDCLPLAQRKALAIKKENHSDETPFAQRRKTLIPTSQMAKIKLELGTPTPKEKKGSSIDDSSDNHDDDDDDDDDEPLAKKRKQRAAGGGGARMAYRRG
ncbi:hypothetical protein DOTSEDRAFT_70027 [Dothistroma septosporum NZE10]|uniref:Uncharacterized protein n=1 Tax=Dothistroma septosporum (strain NZE10 / CBS 128990) TaxID=675120 RepID=N1PZ52_DOTSN|nr:hypothetical protein DOTSEDRAFT_70027 [Dothistroma septosporum NZE10]